MTCHTRRYTRTGVILGALSQLPVKSALDYDYGTYKGFYADNFLAPEFRASRHEPFACWQEGTAVLKFHREVAGAADTVEVKSV